MRHDWQISEKDETAIKNYIATGESEKTGQRTLEKLTRRLKYKIAELTDYHIFETAGAFQKDVDKTLEKYKDYLKSIQLVNTWKTEMRPNTKQNKWRREFYKVGADTGESGIKLLRIRRAK